MLPWGSLDPELKYALRRSIQFLITRLKVRSGSRVLIAKQFGVCSRATVFEVGG